jgi:hypothetical protein
MIAMTSGVYEVISGGAGTHSRGSLHRVCTRCGDIGNMCRGVPHPLRRSRAGPSQELRRTNASPPLVSFGSFGDRGRMPTTKSIAHSPTFPIAERVFLFLFATFCSGAPFIRGVIVPVSACDACNRGLWGIGVRSLRHPHQITPSSAAVRSDPGDVRHRPPAHARRGVAGRRPRGTGVILVLGAACGLSRGPGSNGSP